MHRAWTPDLAYLAQYSHSLRARLSALLPRTDDAPKLIVDRPELSASPTLPIGELAHEHQLDALDRELLMFAACTQADPTLAQLLAAASAPYGLPYACGYVWLRLGSLHTPSFVWTQQFRFAPHRTLRAAQLIELIEHPSANPLLAELRVSSDLVARLRGERCLDERIQSVATEHEVLEPVALPPWPPALLEELRELFSGHRVEQEAALNRPQRHQMRSNLLILSGAAGIGKRSAVMASCHRLGLPLLEVNGAMLPLATTPAQSLALCVRQAALHGDVLFIDDADRALPPDASAVSSLLDALHRFRVLALLATAHPERLDPRLQQQTLAHIRVPELGYEARVASWDLAFNGFNLMTLAAHQAASAFPLAPLHIEKATRRARLSALARLRHIPAENVSAVEVSDECLEQSVWSQLGLTAPKQLEALDWSALILSESTRQQLDTVRNAVRAQVRVFEGWAMKGGKSSALLLLFDGIVGSGKRSTALALARELERSLQRLEQSELLRTLREPHTNLAALHPSSSIILIDPVDDLLDQLSEEDGERIRELAGDQAVILMLTHRPRVLDRARLRPDFRVHFPTPDASSRSAIWRRLAPPSPPLAEDIDFDALGADFTLCASAIRRAILAACFTALASGKLDMHALREAARREQEEGRMVS
ncbi:MAG: ATP-binding protein [Myxococcota bacterium]|jgi:hypothetical protein|nr:ATP-binding protein [Myxococcota bacterium]